jgi:hypothetical protein
MTTKGERGREREIGWLLLCGSQPQNFSEKIELKYLKFDELLLRIIVI